MCPMHVWYRRYILHAWLSSSSNCARSWPWPNTAASSGQRRRCTSASPRLSRSIQNLERRFGSSLFLRSAAGVVPTDLGQLYIERARDLLRMADELEGQAIGHAAFRTGRVDVGGGPYPTDSFLGPAAARFVEQSRESAYGCTPATGTTSFTSCAAGRSISSWRKPAC